jgi:hypothetical protein
MSRPRHPNKHIEAAIQYAESLQWVVLISSGHAWGRLYCPQSSRAGCIISVWSTPRNPENHARHIRNMIDQCPHQNDPEESQADHENEE